MAQFTDVVLDNQSGANFRSELNTILAGLVSGSSGSTEPSGTKYAYQIWIDTSATPPDIKIRNGANNAWITLGTVSTNQGLAGLSGATFTGDITMNAQSDVRFADSDSSNYVAFQAPATISSNVTFTLPATDGTSGQNLTTDASGTLSWATRAALGTAQTFTAEQTFNAGISLDGPYEQASEAVSALAIDCSAGNYFTKAISSNSTFTFSNVPSSGTAYAFMIEIDVTGTGTTITWPSSVEFPDDTAPTLADTKTHLFMFITSDGGTKFRGAYLVDYDT
jgi:hypothetical protein